MKRFMKIRRSVAALLIPAMLCLAGCRSQKSLEELEGRPAPATVAAEPNALERQGLAWARVLTAPLCLISLTYAECEKTPAGVFLLPFVCVWTVPAGAFAAAANFVIGSLEILTWQQCTTLEYPWQTFDPKVAQPWNDSARQAFENTMTENGDGCADGSCAAYSPPPPPSSSGRRHGGREARSHGHRSSGGRSGREARSHGHRSSGGSHHSSGRRSGGGHRSRSRGRRSTDGRGK